MKEKPLVFCGRESYQLSKSICDLLRVRRSDLDIMEFADGEPWFKLTNHQEIKGRHVVVIQSTAPPVLKTYMDLWCILWGVKSQQPRRVTVVMPFMGYRRQERDKDGGETVTAQMAAEFTVKAGATDVVLCDPHAPILVDYFTEAGAMVKVVRGNQAFSELLAHRDLSNHKIFTPDPGRKDEASQLAEILNLELLIGRKLRYDMDKSKSEGMQGDAQGQMVIIREDEISTGGTIINSCQDLSDAGAIGAIILATHGVFVSGSAQKMKRIDFIKEIWITDSVYFPWEKRIDKINIKSIAHLLAKAVLEIHES